MMVNTKFDMHQYVGIVDYGCKKGRIVEISFTGANLLYKVVFWDNGDLKSVYVSEDEITTEINEVAG